ncbi:general substrate transporter [Aspergillus venezuelensis]
MASKTVLQSVGPELARVLPDDNIPWYRKRHLLRLNFSLLSLFLLSASDGYDGTLMNGLQALPRWQEFMDTPTGPWLGFVNAVQNLSAFALYPVVAWCNDRYGRKVTLGINFLWLALAVALQTSAKNSTMFVFGRLFVGGSASFTAGSAPVLMAEAAYPTHRGTITALFQCGWYVGSFLAAWVTFATRNAPANWSWRIPSLLQSSKERVVEARAFLVKYHAGGDENSPLANFELQEIVNSLALEAQYRRSNSWLDLFRGRGNLHRSFISVTLGVFAQWNGVGIVSYYLAPVLRSVGITSVRDQTMISGFLQLWNLILAIASAFNVDRFGRRPLFLVSSIGMLASYIVISGLSGSFAQSGTSSIGTAVIPFLFIYYGFYDIAFTPLLVSYTCEIWPYNLRAWGLGLGMNSTRIALFFNTFVSPIILGAIAWKYYINPETKGYTLEEMAVLFDGNRKGENLKGVRSDSAGERKEASADVSHVEKV